MVGKVVLLQGRIPCLSPGNYDVYTLAKDIWYIHHPAVYYSRDPFKRFSLFLSPKFLSTRNFIIPRWCRDVPLCVKMKGIALISEQRRKKTKFNFGRYSKVV